MLVTQANIFEEDVNQPSGFAEFEAALAAGVEEFGKPVVLAHSDTRTFRIDNPLPGLSNFTRVETFSSPQVHWVRASIDARSPQVFSFQPEFVEENLTP